MKKIKDLHGLFVHELKDLYGAEKQLTRALPKMAKSAHDEELREAFQKHLSETEEQMERLEKLLGELEISPRGAKCPAMEGLIEEAKELLDEKAPAEVLDAGLIGAAQKVEHYEIAAYGTLRALARQLGMNQWAEIFQQTLDEEKKSNEKLNEIALGHVNEDAASTGEEDEGQAVMEDEDSAVPE